jgi:hypothetical protein
MGLLLPREKELWQMGLELSLRLGKKDREPELTDGELQSVATRLGAMVRDELEHSARLATPGAQGGSREAVRSRRLEFLIQALGRTERLEAIGPLIQVLGSGREPYVTAAMRELGELQAIPGSRDAVEPIVGVLTASSRAETNLVACTVLSVLAGPDDQRVIDALTAVRLSKMR